MIQAGLTQTATLILGSLAVVAHSWELGHFDSPPVTFTSAQGQGITTTAAPLESNIFTVHDVIPHRLQALYQELISVNFSWFLTNQLLLLIRELRSCKKILSLA